MIIGTAGHIDHGKSALVRALTGVDPDRLPEEKRRGITIDVGYAHLELRSGALAAFVDVPGHERFIHNMLAGIGGIDYVMLAVAADDGVMPQTREHLQILNSLNVRRGLAVITKADSAPDDRIQSVVTDIRELLMSTTLANSNVLVTSARTGLGMSELRATLEEASQTIAPRSLSLLFRMPIDRSFTVNGAGTIVTGTVHSGSICVGDRLVISPCGTEVRVRALQRHGTIVDSVGAGQRCAANLSGPRLNADSGGRGQWLVDPALDEPTRRIDARIMVDKDERTPLRHWSMVKFHIGTAHIDARIALLDGTEVRPGQCALAQLVLPQPVVALHGDRFILRDQSARATIGFGAVLDPWPARSGRRRPERLSRLAALDQINPPTAFARLLAVSQRGVDLASFARNFALSAGESQALFQSNCHILPIGENQRLGFAPGKWEEYRKSVLAILGDLHRSHPDAVAFPPSAIHAAAGLPIRSLSVFTSLLRALAEEDAIEGTGHLFRLAGKQAIFSQSEEALWLQIRSSIEASPLWPPTVREHTTKLGLSERVVRTLLWRFKQAGRLTAVTLDRYFLPADVARMAAILSQLSLDHPTGQISTPLFRDAIGIGRNGAIEILEFFDASRLTARRGAFRVLRQDRLSAFEVSGGRAAVGLQ